MDQHEGDDAANDEANSNEVRRALQHAVMQICTKAEEETDSSMTPHAIAALAELTYLYATTCLARDLDCFASHGNRRSINPDDVKLVARKNPEILRKLETTAKPSQSRRNSTSTKTTKHETQNKQKAAVSPKSTVLKENRGAQNSKLECDVPSDSETSSDSLIDIRKVPPPSSRNKAKNDDDTSSLEDCFSSENELEASTRPVKNKPMQVGDDSDDGSSSDDSRLDPKPKKAKTLSAAATNKNHDTGRATAKELMEVWTNAMSINLSSDDEDD
jgi:centromere protein S